MTMYIALILNTTDNRHLAQKINQEYGISCNT